jgi:hypothetical protein
MKWVLVVVVLNTPVKTDLVFDSLQSCLNTEHTMRSEWAEVVNKVAEWQRQNPDMPDATKRETTNFVRKQNVWGTCIPAKS